MGHSAHHRQRVASLLASVFGALLVTSSAHAGAPDPVVDIAAVFASDGVHGYGRSLDTALDALVDDGAVDSAAGAPPTDGASRADLLRFLAAGSTMAVVVQGAVYGPALTEVAVALPDEAFIWIPGDAPTDPATRPAGLPNVSTVYADVAPAATLLGELLEDGRLAEVERLGWTGSSEPSGDDGIFITALIGAASLDSRSVVLTSRLSDEPADSAPAGESFDALLVSGRASSDLPAPLRVEIAGSLGDDESDAPADGRDGGRIVVGFHYDVALAEILAGYETGELGGTEHHLTLENGGLTLEATDPEDAAVLRDALVDAGLVEPVSPSSTTTVVINEPAGTTPAETEPADPGPEPPPATPPIVPPSTSPRSTTTIVPATLPPVTGGPITTEPTTSPTTGLPTTTVDVPTTAPDPPPPTDPTTTTTAPPDVTEAAAPITAAIDVQGAASVD